MNEAEIKCNFKIDKQGVSTLNKQLSEALKKFVASNPPGTRIPSERNIAKVLGIDRGTVKKVIAEFARDGLLVRNGRRGTFVAGMPDVGDPFHPLEIEAYFIGESRSTMRLALYESKPPLRTFWENAVNLFNQSDNEANAVIEWVPDIGIDKYPDYLRESKPDVLQTGLAKPIDYPLSLLPGTLRGELLDPLKFYCDNFGDAETELADRIVPVHFSTIAHSFNATMAKRLNLRKVAESLRDEPIEVFRRCAKVFGSDFLIGGHAWDYVLAMGVPPDDRTVDYEFFLSRFVELGRFRRVGNVFSTTQNYSMEPFDRFFRGESFFNTGHITLMNRQIADLPFEPGFSMPRLDDGMALPCTFSGLSVSADTPLAAQAVEFLKFILSADIQSKLVVCGLSAYLKGANKELAHLLGVDKSLLQKTLGSTINIGCKKRHISFFLVFLLKDIFHQFFNDRISPEGAAEIASNRWQEYYLDS